MPHRFLRFGIGPLIVLLVLCTEPRLLAAAPLGLDLDRCRNPELAGLVIDGSSTQISALRANVRPNAFAEIFGDVLVYNKDITLRADTARLNFEDNVLTLNHDVAIIDGSLCIIGAQASGNFLNGQGSVNEAQFLQRQSALRGSASQIILDGRQRFELSEGVVTRCPGESDFWQISSRSLVADQAQSTLTVKDMVLRVKQVPILYLPYLKIPVTTQRQSGFLPIGLSQNSRNGVETDLKYYFNIRPNLDATVGLRHLSRRGPLIQTEVRSLGASHRGQLNFELLPEDRIDRLSATASRPNQDRFDRNIMSLFYDFQFAGLTTNINFSKASDLNFLRDFGSELAPYSGHLGGLRPTNPQYERILPALNQRISFGLEKAHLKADLSYQGFQMLVPQLDQQVEKRPELNIQYDRSWGTVRTKTQLLLTESRLKNPTAKTFQGQRQVFSSQLTWPRVGSLGYLESSIGAQHRRYRSRLAPETSTSLSNPFVHFLAGTQFTNRNPARRTDRVLEPKVSVTVGRKDQNAPQLGLDTAWLEPNYQSIFNPSDTAGADGGITGRSVALGIDHRWLRQSNGEQLGLISLGQALHSGKASSLQGRAGNHRSYLRAELSPTPSMTGQLDLTYNHRQNAIGSGFLSLSYRPRPEVILSLQHRYRAAQQQFGHFTLAAEASVSQIALLAPIGKNFQIRGLLGRNNRSSKEIESLLGVSYNGCCWSLEAAYRKNFDPKLTWVNGQYQVDSKSSTGIFLSFELKGLMRLGSDMTRVFQRTVPGFTTSTR